MNNTSNSYDNAEQNGKKHGKKNRTRMWALIVAAVFFVAFCVSAFTGCVAKKEIDALRVDLAATSQSLAALQSNYEAAQAEIEALKGSNEAANAEIESLKGSNEAANAEIEALKGSNEAANAEIEALKGSNEAANAEIEALKGSNEAANAEIESLKGSNEAAQKEIDSLKSQIDDLLNYFAPSTSDEKIRIYIDQGHNPTSYDNSGATANGLYEQDLTFEIGRLLAGVLMVDGRFEVRLSRPTETTVLGTDQNSSLEARVNGAKEFEADYFISLHVNAFELDTANGIEVLVAEESGASYTFGNHLLAGVVGATGLRDRGMKYRPDLYVLRNATMPAAIVEMGFITNATDSALLASNPELFVQGIYNGILDHFDLEAVSDSGN